MSLTRQKFAAYLLLVAYGATGLLGHGLHHLPGLGHDHGHAVLAEQHDAEQHTAEQHDHDGPCDHDHAAACPQDADHRAVLPGLAYRSGHVHDLHAHHDCVLCQFLAQGQHHAVDRAATCVVASVPARQRAESISLPRLLYAPYAPRGPPQGDLAFL